MSAVVVDTHAAIWYLSADPRISAPAVSAMDAAVMAGSPVCVPSICLVETTYLVEKGRLPEVAFDRLNGVVSAKGSGFTCRTSESCRGHRRSADQTRPGACHAGPHHRGHGAQPSLVAHSRTGSGPKVSAGSNWHRWCASPGMNQPRLRQASALHDSILLLGWSMAAQSA